MPKGKYTIEDLSRDMEILILNGLIEIKGVNEEGKLLYGVTEKSLQMSEAELTAAINDATHPAG